MIGIDGQKISVHTWILTTEPEIMLNSHIKLACLTALSSVINCQAQVSPNENNLQLRYVASYPTLITSYNKGQAQNWPSLHYLSTGKQQGLSIKFNAWLYLATYDNLISASAGLSDADRETWAANHYIKHGVFEGKVYDSPAIQQNARSYAAGYSDTCYMSPTSAAYHYVTIGFPQKRNIRPAINCTSTASGQFPTDDENLLNILGSYNNCPGNQPSDLPYCPVILSWYKSELSNYKLKAKIASMKYSPPSPTSGMLNLN